MLHTGASDGASYVYDNAGNRTSKQNLLTGITESYSYDPIYQLTQVLQGANTTESYSYDMVGNRLSSLLGQHWYNNSNELTTLAAIVYAYDNNGNMTSKTSGTNVTGYTWDIENRLSSVNLPNNGGAVSFRYDPVGRRIQKATASTITNYIYDGPNIIAELNATGGVVASYTHGAGVDEPLAMRRGGYIAYYHADGLGSITSLTNVTGQTVGTYVYNGFGSTTTTEGIFNPFRYTAREQDPETGLYYYRARYYDPQIGRFISEDPLRILGGINFYAYVKNMPIIAKDPNGTTIYICSRPAFYGRGPRTAGPNHAFLYDDRNGDDCGMGDPPRHENVGSQMVTCTKVPGTEGNDISDKVMSCCHQKASSKEWQMPTWRPGTHDCHTMAGQCLTENGVSNPGVPGGRFGCNTCGDQ